MKIVFTVCNRHQLSHALTLGASLRRNNPDYHFMIGWVDPSPLADLPDWVQLIRIEELELSEWDAMTRRYYDFELLAASKPFFARFILHKKPPCTELIYLAPATWVLGPFDSVVNPEIFLQSTPHRLTPIHPNPHLDDKAILNIGMYHAGSWILHPDGQENELLDWWCERTVDRAHFDLCQGMCLDQLWMNYLPVLFQGVQTVRNPGWHYGLHAIPNHSLSNREGYFVNGQPLITVDFSGLESYHPVWSDHTKLVDSKPEWAELRTAYRREFRAQRIPALDENSLPYGKNSKVKSFRKQRKGVVAVLNQVIERIETYDLTHN